MRCWISCMGNQTPWNPEVAAICSRVLSSSSWRAQSPSRLISRTMMASIAFANRTINGALGWKASAETPVSTHLSTLSSKLTFSTPLRMIRRQNRVWDRQWYRKKQCECCVPKTDELPLDGTVFSSTRSLMHVYACYNITYACICVWNLCTCMFVRQDYLCMHVYVYVMHMYLASIQLRTNLVSFAADDR